MGGARYTNRQQKQKHCGTLIEQHSTHNTHTNMHTRARTATFATRIQLNLANISTLAAYLRVIISKFNIDTHTHTHMWVCVFAISVLQKGKYKLLSCHSRRRQFAMRLRFSCGGLHAACGMRPNLKLGEASSAVGCWHCRSPCGISNTQHLFVCMRCPIKIFNLFALNKQRRARAQKFPVLS